MSLRDRLAVVLLLALCAPAMAAPGDLDTSFASGGRSINTQGRGFPRIAVQSDGRPLAAYGATFTVTRVRRFTEDGALDPTWGTAGTVDSDLGSGSEQATGIVVQPDGRVLVSVSGGFGIVVARFTTDGVLDLSFGAGGRSDTGLSGSSEGHKLALQPDGRIVVVGAFQGEMAVARLLANGTLDSSLAGTGIATVPISGTADAVVLQANGKIVAAGPANGDTAVFRLLSSGVIDSSFGTSGSTTFDMGGPETDSVGDLALQPDGKILLAGGSGDQPSGFPTGEAYVARLLPDGSLDPGWAGTGIVQVGPSAGFAMQARAVVVLGNQKVLVGGFDFGGSLLFNAFLAAFDEPGTPDPTWGGTGLVLEGYGSLLGSLASDIAVQGTHLLTAGEGQTIANTVFTFVGRHDLGEFCGDGVVQSGEECDDGSVLPGDCCSPTCTFIPSGTVCGDDGNSCSEDLCDGAGTCDHPLLADGTPCDDGSACTNGETCTSGTCGGGVTGGAGCANPLVCYKASRSKGSPKFEKILGISLVDDLESGDFDARVPFELCVPAVVNDAPIEDPEIRQVAYKIKASPGEPKHVKQTSIEVEDALGVHSFDTKKAELLLVPSGMEYGVPASAPPIGTALHYKCYRASPSKGTPSFEKTKVKAEDEFEDRFYDVFQPRRLCYAADKNGEGIVDADALLTCYRVRRAAGQLPHDRIQGLLQTSNQFGGLQLDTKTERDLCLPATLVP